LSCDKLSFSIICKYCQNLYLIPKFIKKEVISGFYNYSFYDYEDIKDLIHTKYDTIGSQIFKILAKNSFKKFSDSFKYNDTLYAINIDNNISKGYSHSAILTSSLSSSIIIPQYNILQAKNNKRFANKSYQFRLLNPREFKYNKPLFKNIKEVILIDDIITTSLTMLEAKDPLTRYNIKSLFCLTLCNLQ
jgi:competence protein ComFC